MISQQEKNYFDTFGFLILRNFFNREELRFLRGRFDYLYESWFNRSFNKIRWEACIKSKTYMVPSFVDSDEALAKLYIRKGIFDIPVSLLGEGAQYWGSDGSLFARGSLWHRDTATLGKSLKMNCYLNSGSSLSGGFSLIPGSHCIGDRFSSLLSQALSWPDPSPKGGFNEKDFFPKTHSPNEGFFKQKLLSTKHQIPYYTLRFNEGDLILFDNRLVHVVTRPVVPKLRRLITSIFVDYPSNDFLHPADYVNRTSTELRNELTLLKKLECDQYGVKPYPDEFAGLMREEGLSHLLSAFGSLHDNEELETSYSGYHTQQRPELASHLKINFVDRSKFY